MLCFRVSCDSRESPDGQQGASCGGPLIGQLIEHPSEHGELQRRRAGADLGADLAPLQEAEVVRDVVAMVGHPKGKHNPDRPLRLVEIECMPHRKPSGKTARGGPTAGETVRILTDRLDLPADVIGLLYKHRWQIEIFFRFFKHVLGCRHLLSYCENGIELQTYAAIIACLLIALWTGRKATLSTYRMLCWYFSGWADDEELQNHIAKLKGCDGENAA